MQSSIILLLFKSHLSFFFDASGYQNMQRWKSNFWTRQILFIDHCQKLWLVEENCKRVQQCVNVLLYDLKGRKKMMMKPSSMLVSLLFKMRKRSLIQSISHISYPTINLQMSSQSRSRSLAMNKKIEKVVQNKMNLRWWWSKSVENNIENWTLNVSFFKNICNLTNVFISMPKV